MRSPITSFLLLCQVLSADAGGASMDASRRNKGDPLLFNKPNKTQSMLDKCSEHSGWFPRGSWEASSQRVARSVCDLLPPAFSGTRRYGAQDGSGVARQGQAQNRLGSLPTHTMSSAQRVSSASEGARGEEGAQQDILREAVDAQGAHNLLPPAPSTRSAAVGAQEVGGAPSDDHSAPWHQAFAQISKQLQVRCYSIHRALITL